MVYRVQRHCDECGAAYVASRRDGRFCSTPCKKTFQNRRMTRGAQLLDLLMTDYTDRQNRYRKSGLLQKASRRLLSRWRDEDRAAGRAHCGDPAAILMADMTLTADYEFAMGNNPWAGSSGKPA